MKTQVVFFGCMLTLLSCVKEPIIEMPFVSTSEMGLITDATAICGGSIVSMGGAEVTDRGLCWSKESEPSILDSTVSATESTSFTCTMRNLEPGTLYYVCAYATNKGGTAYGFSRSFTTNSVSVRTMMVTDVKASSANCRTYAGIVGGSTTAKRKGLCWGTSTLPTVLDSIIDLPFEDGVTSFKMNGLKHMTTYYARAFLQNASGFIYGNEVSFTTKSGEPVIVTGPATKIGAFSTSASMQATDFGGLDVSECGVCWSKAPNPVVLDQKMVLGMTNEVFTCDLKGLDASTYYHIRGYIQTNEGVFYGPDVSFSTLDAVGTFSDIDNNIYRYATFFGKTWMLDNLRTRHYQNGDPIDLVTNETFDVESKVGKYLNYNNMESSSVVYGYLYDWYAICDPRKVAPIGWHIATDAEWKLLVDNLGGMLVAGRKLMDYSSGMWPNEIGTSNECGFHALPGGILGVTNLFLLQGLASYWWSSNNSNGLPVWYVHWFYKDIKNIDRSGFNALSVRCVRDY